MKKKFQLIAKEILIAGVLLWLVSSLISYLRTPTLKSNQLPLQTVTLLDGNSYTLRKGKPIIIHFWATWCRTCALESSNIETVSKHYDVLSIAVNSGSDAQIQAYMNEKSLSFKVINDKEGRWAKQFNIEAFPTTFIYNSQGEHRFSEVGYTTTAGLLARLQLVE